MGLQRCILRREHCAHFGLWKQVTSDFRYNHCLLYSCLSEASKTTTDIMRFFYKTKNTVHQIFRKKMSNGSIFSSLSILSDVDQQCVRETDVTVSSLVTNY